MHTRFIIEGVAAATLIVSTLTLTVNFPMVMGKFVALPLLVLGLIQNHRHPRRSDLDQ